jgi:phosphonate transport system substrate-binding protein
MRTKKWLLLVLVLALVFAACGDDDETTTTAAAVEETTTTAAAVEETTTTEAVEEWPESITFGFVPSQEQAELQDDIQPFMDVLSEALGIDVEGFVTTDYTGLVVAMGSGQADLGAFGPFGYVLAKQQYPEIEALIQSVRYGAATYHGQWFVNADIVDEFCDEDPAPGGFETVDGVATLMGLDETTALIVGEIDEGVDPGLACEGDLSAIAGHTVAFTDETSTSGYLFPALQLIELGIDPETGITPIFSGGHDAAVTAVYNGDADVGISFDDARREIRETDPDVGSRVIVIGITPEIPNDVVAVRGDLPDDLKQAIYDAVADYLATEEGQAVFDTIYEWTDIRRALDSDFQVVRDAAEELGITEPVG